MALTAKQRRALAKAPKSRRAQLLRSFKASMGNGRRSTADKVLATGVGAPVGKPFGTMQLAIPRSPGRAPMEGWNAFHPYHLPLPRAVGPYTVVRTSVLHTSTAKYIQFGAFRRAASDAWSNIVGFEDRLVGNPINDTTGGGNAVAISVPAPFASNLIGSSFTCVPAAISVQVMSPGPLVGVEGQVAMAVCPTQLDVNARTETWNDLSTEIVSYMRPRLCAVPKLALRGVHMDSYPLNMAAVSEFSPLVYTLSGVTFPMDDSIVRPIGFAPLVLVNQNTATLNLLVSVEWRVRFDIGNPAVASHQHHGVTPDSIWNKCINTAVALGNGVRDIADVTANLGQAIGAARRMLRPPPVPMIVD